MSAELDQTLRGLHACYCELSQNQPPYALCERRWLEFHNAGLAIDDLRLTLEFVLRTNKKRERQYWIPLRFGSFVGDLERFSDLLGESRADKRARDFKTKHSFSEGKASVLRATGRPDAPAVPENTLSAAEALAKLKASL